MGLWLWMTATEARVWYWIDHGNGFYGNYRDRDTELVIEAVSAGEAERFGWRSYGADLWTGDVWDDRCCWKQLMLFIGWSCSDSIEWCWEGSEEPIDGGGCLQRVCVGWSGLYWQGLQKMELKNIDSAIDGCVPRRWPGRTNLGVCYGFDSNRKVYIRCFYRCRWCGRG